MVRAVLLVSMVVACKDNTPLPSPTASRECNIDSDCDTFTTCSCNGCVAHHRNSHPEMCPTACEATPCAGKQAVCVSGACEIE